MQNIQIILLIVLNLSKPNIKDVNFKLSRSLKYNLKKLARNKTTSHLIDKKKFEKGNLIVEQNSLVNGIYFLIRGNVKIYSIDEGRGAKIFRLASKGELVGFSSLNSPMYWSSAETLDEVEAYFINNKNLKFLLKKNSKINLLLMNALILKLQNYEIRQRYLSVYPSTERVIEAILLIAAKFGVTKNFTTWISLCTSRLEIASIANTSYENTIRIINRLKKNKYIDVQKKNIIIPNKGVLIDKLKKYCCSKVNNNELFSCYLDDYY